MQIVAGALAGTLDLILAAFPLVIGLVLVGTLADKDVRVDKPAK